MLWKEQRGEICITPKAIRSLYKRNSSVPNIDVSMKKRYHNFPSAKLCTDFHKFITALSDSVFFNYVVFISYRIFLYCIGMHYISDSKVGRLAKSPVTASDLKKK